jgi:hypothetical protein
VAGAGDEPQNLVTAAKVGADVGRLRRHSWDTYDGADGIDPGRMNPRSGAARNTS